MSSRRVALVELDTSHPGAFVPLLRDLGYEVTAVLDTGAVRPLGYASEFASRFGIPQVLSRVDEVPAAVDAALLLGVDWDERYSVACRLLDAGTAVLLDKPVAGRVSDLRDLAARAAAGQRVGGGSSLRTAPEAVAWRQRYDGPAPSSVLAGCAGHPFYYGVHAVSLAQAVLGPGFVAARALDGDGLRGVLRHACGAEVLVDVPPPASSYPYHATVVTPTGVEHLRPDPGGLYGPYLAAVLGHLLDGSPAPYTPESLVEPDLAVLALAHSTGDWVSLHDLPGDLAPWSGADFTASYRAPS
jgi:GFO/IDH/MocA oxidoreductase family protein